MTDGATWRTADRLLRRAARQRVWAGQPLWAWGPAGRSPRPSPARPGPYQPVPAWVTGLAGFTDDRTGRPRALVTSYAGARVVLDLLDGALVGAADERAHASAAEIARIDGEQMIVSAAGAGYLQVSDLESGRSRWRQWCGDVRSLATVTLAGRPLAVLTSGSAHLEIWSLGVDRGERLATLRTGVERIAVLAATELGADALVAVGTSAGRVSLWRLGVAPGGGDGIRTEPAGERVFEVSGLVTVLNFADWQGRRILLGAAGRAAQGWDLVDGRTLGPAFTGHTGQVNSVVVGRLGDRPVLWSGDDATVRAWLPETGGQLGETFRYPYEAAPTRTIAAEIDGRPMLVTGDGAGAVWIWDPERPYPFRRAGPSGDRYGGTERGPAVGARLASVEIAGRRVLLTGFAGRSVRGFDPVAGTEVGVPLDGVPDAPTLVPGDCPAVARSGPDHLELWDAATGERIGRLPYGPAGSVGLLASGLVAGARVLLVAAGAALFRLDTGTGRLARASTGHVGQIQAVTTGELAGLPVALTAADDDTVRLWDLTSWGRGWPVLDGHGGAAYAVTTATIDGRGLVFSAGRNGQVRYVDLTDLVPAEQPGRDPADPILAGVVPEPAVLLTATGPVRALAVVGVGRVTWLVAADGSTLRWQPIGRPGAPGQTIDVGAEVTGLLALPGLLVVAAGDSLLGYRPPPG